MKTCKNCTTRYTNKFNFCPNCGAKWVDYRLTPRKITGEFTEKYLGTDNVFLKTCFTLFRFPEDVINGYITGQRKKYVNVINFFFISLTLFGLHIFILKTFYPELIGLADLTGENETIGVYLSAFLDYTGLFTSIFIPFYALTGWVVFYNKSYNYVEHLVLFGYVYGVINILTILSTPIIIIGSFNFLDFSYISLIINILLIAWYYKRIFKLSLWNTALKTLLMTILYFIIQTVLMTIVGILAIVIIKWFYPEVLEGLKFNVNGTEL
ncbi:MAG: DUF3667 domain-containing protein [Nonlabens sp.]|uniref:DUF3667 domain-containing protein n=1 Tax=Nonlabens sp. TaxID=1888209 RepID=UPI003EF49732